MQTSLWAPSTTLALVLSACSSEESSKSAGNAFTAVAIAADTLRPALVSAAVLDDSDDPAIWIDTVNPSRSLVIGPRVNSAGRGPSSCYATITASRCIPPRPCTSG